MKKGQYSKEPTLWDTLESGAPPAEWRRQKFRWEDLSASEAGMLQAVIDRLNPKTLKAQIAIAELANAVGVTRDAARAILRRLSGRGLLHGAQPGGGRSLANIWTLPAIFPPSPVASKPPSLRKRPVRVARRHMVREIRTPFATANCISRGACRNGGR